MFKRIRESWRRYKFTKAFRQVAESNYLSGYISLEEYTRCLEAKPDTMKRAYNQLLADPDMLGGIRDWDWDSILEWLFNYFIPAMRIIIPILLMDEDSK